MSTDEQAAVGCRPKRLFGLSALGLYYGERQEIGVNRGYLYPVIYQHSFQDILHAQTQMLIILSVDLIYSNIFLEFFNDTDHKQDKISVLMQYMVQCKVGLMHIMLKSWIANFF